MTLPTITVRIGFDSDPFDDPQTWTDVSHLGIAYGIRRGRNHELDRMEAGNATVLLKNFDGSLWPNNTGSPYYPGVRPRKRINIRATYNGITYDRFNGFIRRWKPGWLDGYGLKPTMSLECVDLVDALSRDKLTDGTGYASEKSGERVENVLGALGWPAALRDIDTGQTTLQATGPLDLMVGIEHLFLVQNSERGILYVAPDGDVIFEDRHHRFNSPHTVSQATFSDVAGNNSYRAIEPSYDDQIYNKVSIEREGGTAQTAEDADSIQAFGPLTYSESGLLMTSDNEALSQAQYILSRYKNPTFRGRALVIMPQRSPANLYPKVLTYDISTRITLVLSQASLSTDYFIEGISEDYDARQGVFSTRWQLSEADAQAYWTLGISGLSELGQTTRLGY